MIQIAIMCLFLLKSNQFISSIPAGNNKNEIATKYLTQPSAMVMSESLSAGRSNKENGDLYGKQSIIREAVGALPSVDLTNYVPLENENNLPRNTDEFAGVENFISGPESKRSIPQSDGSDVIRADKLPSSSVDEDVFVFKHHNNTELANVLYGIHQKCPTITRVYTLSEKSVRGVPLYVIEFSLKPGFHQRLIPEFRYVANMHGNEVLGRELLLKLADHLCTMYRYNDPDIVKLISITRIHLLPSMNPDGWQLSTNQGGTDYLIGRNNYNGIDLNRNFPDLDKVMFGNERSHLYNNNHLLAMINNSPDTYEPETKAVIRMILQTAFVLSANLHGGDLVANYPYDASRSGLPQGEYSETPDDATFKYLAQVYSKSHADMADKSRYSCSVDKTEFNKQGGVTNGAKWYSVHGGMQDFNYLASNDFEITLELGCEKYPKAELLMKEWERNKDALINFIWQVHIGVKGLIKDAYNGQPIANAVIHVKNVTDGVNYHILHDITSIEGGDYYRLLTPGRYQFTVTAPGYFPEQATIVVENPPYEEATIQNFYLQPVGDAWVNIFRQERDSTPIDFGNSDVYYAQYQPNLNSRQRVNERDILKVIS